MLAGGFLILAGGPGQTRAAAQWTIMVYLIGDNNLECDQLKAFYEIALSGSSADVNVVVQFDRSPKTDPNNGYCKTTPDWSSCKRFYVAPGMEPTPANALEDLGEVDMGDPNVLRDFINWGASKYPANRYALILSCHGGSWSSRREKLYRALPYAKTAAEREAIRKELERLQRPPSVGHIGPDEDPGDGLTNREIKQALQSATKVDLLALDACETAFMEAAYELRDAGPTVLVAAETIDRRYPYTWILNALNWHSAWTPAELARCIVDKYVSRYDSEGMNMAAIDLTKMATLAPKISSLADTLRYRWNTDQKAVKAAAWAVLSAIQSAVYEQHGPLCLGTHGLKIWFPRVQSDYDLNKTDYPLQTDFGSQTTWQKFLETYLYGMGSYVSSARGACHEIRSDHVDLYEFCDNLYRSDMTLWEALDCPVLNWYGGGPVGPGWIGLLTTDQGHQDAAQSCQVGHGQSAPLQTVVTGPGTLYFSWKVCSETNFDWLTFAIDGVPKGRISGVIDWQMNSFKIPPGLHVLEWSYAKDGTNSYGLDCGWVDGVSYYLDLDHALDNPGLTFTTGGTASWLGQDRTKAVGDSAAQSGLIPDAGGTSWLETKVSGPGTLNFYWKVSSEAYRDLLKFYLDTAMVGKISGEVDWQLLRLTIPAGQHTLRWEYKKDANSKRGGWIALGWTRCSISLTWV